MDISLILFLIILLWFTFRGYKSGFLAVVFRLLSLAGAYAAAFLLTLPTGHWVSEHTQIKGLVAFMVSGVMIFLLTSLLLEILFSLVKKTIQKNGEVGQSSAIGGAIAGLIIGGIVGLVAVWMVSLMNQLLAKEDTTITSPGVLETVAHSAVAKIITSIISTTTGQEEVAQLTASVLTQPKQTVEQLRRLLESQTLRELFGSPYHASVIQSGDIEQVKQLPAFQKLMQDPDFIALGKEAGITESDQNATHAFAEKIVEMWARVDYVKKDPEVQAILQDPQFKSLATSGNLLRLLNSDKFIVLTEKVMSDEATRNISARLPSAQVDSIKAPSSKTTPEEPSKIYRWVDENGRVHYSDKKPEEQKN